MIDSGANVSMTNNKAILHDLEKTTTAVTVTSSNGERSPVLGKGKLKLHSNPKIDIDNVLYVPGLTRTLLGTKSFTDLGLTIVINSMAGRSFRLKSKMDYTTSPEVQPLKTT